jgi:hypothetical protein
VTDSFATRNSQFAIRNSQFSNQVMQTSQPTRFAVGQFNQIGWNFAIGFDLLL